MEIRKATKSDAAAVFTCAVEAFKDYILLIDRTPGPMLEDYYEAIKHHHVFVASTKGSIDGFILIKDGNVDFMWLDALAVYPGSRNVGVGGSLISFGEKFIKSMGKSECRLYTHVKYERSIAIYQHLGYQIYDRIQENGYDRYYLKKVL
ncbi:GNAT family N-acetyltransferase [Clostridium aminobutyricum]|uniref:GNAT family N-acetyltransferase n=1 Tax=Clostridium aminobutyricum TaxID=33953 RepID=A0A939DBI5_CLOAM|nr:GNAT family N-acetyltransferase [Clostridium aminobutyricum]MBN7774228.1 GNAT family N-acetyltransferase [Clostridium aminobutyricum]